jgi:hypothetical protein
MMNLPEYQCHKRVRAAKIQAIWHVSVRPAVALMVLVGEEGIKPVEVPVAFIEKHAPEVGGYLVVYEDGYRSYSPSKAFEEGYTKL